MNTGAIFAVVGAVIVGGGVAYSQGWLPFGAPARDKAFKECTFEIMRMFPGVETDYLVPSVVKEAMQACMEAKGFQRDASSKSCSLQNVEMQADCYR